MYDIDGDGTITYDEMLQIVRSIYKMTGQMVNLPSDEDTPEKVRVLAIIRNTSSSSCCLTFSILIFGALIESRQDIPEYGS